MTNPDIKPELISTNEKGFINQMIGKSSFSREELAEIFKQLPNKDDNGNVAVDFLQISRDWASCTKEDFLKKHDHLMFYLSSDGSTQGNLDALIESIRDSDAASIIELEDSMLLRISE